MATTGPFRGLSPYDEGARDLFFGRAAERESLAQTVLGERFRLGLLTGPSGIGKTSLVRAGLIPQLSQRGALAVYLTDYADFERDLGRALARAAGTAESDDVAGQLAHLVAAQPQGAVLIFDHIGDALARDPEGRYADALTDFMKRVARAASRGVRFLLVAEEQRLFWVGALEQRIRTAIAPWARSTLGPLSAKTAEEVIERTVLAGGTYFEEGLAHIVAEDLAQDGQVVPAELQIICRTAIEMRATNVARYRKTGGAPTLALLFLERAVQAAGGEVGMRLLSALAELSGRQTLSASELGVATGLQLSVVERTASALRQGGVVRAERSADGERYALAHEVLAGRVRDFVGGLRQKTAQARLVLQRRTALNKWLRPKELMLVRRYGSAAIGAEEDRLIRRSVLLLGMFASAVVFGALALFGLLYYRAATSYEARLEDGRLVVRLSRPTGILRWLPRSPAFGSILGDTGVPASSLTDEAVLRLGRGWSGPIESVGGEPSWLRDVIRSLRPVLRGSALAVSGQSAGYAVLKEAFRDPSAQRAVLTALANAGHGEPAEGEILSAALADDSPELRRMAVEVAATIDARRPRAHVTLLRQALADRSAPVARQVVLVTTRLGPDEAAEILSAALSTSAQVELRRAAVEAATALFERDVAAAATAVRPAVVDADPATRRAGVALLEKALGSAPGRVQPVLEKVVSDDGSPEAMRVTALVALRHASGIEPNALGEALDRAVRGQSEKLRAAALPLYARVGAPDKALPLVQAAQAGTPPMRAAAAAALGALAARKVEVTPALRLLAADPSLEVRLEATRALGAAGRDAVALLDRASRDGNPEVERAAVEALAQVARANPYGAAGVLERVVREGRTSMRRAALEALGRVGEVRPGAATTALGRGLREADPQLRAAAVAGLCVVARRSPTAVYTSLRLVLRDPDASVRQRLASCIRDSAALAPRVQAALAADPDAAVRAAAAEGLGAVGKAADAGALAALAGDRDRRVRLAALRAAAKARVLRDPERTLVGAMGTADEEEKLAILDVARALAVAGPVRAAAGDTNPAVRRAAAQAAPALGEGGNAILATALDDADPQVRIAAMRALAGGGPDDPPRPSDDSPVKRAAGGTPEVAGPLELLARNGTPEERAAAVAALAGSGRAGTDHAARLVEEMLGMRSELLRLGATRAAGELALRVPARALPLLERALGDPAYDVRRAATPLLARAYARTLVPGELATRLLRTEDQAARRTALLEALARQAAEGEHAEEARRVLERLAREGPPLARLGAAIVRGYTGLPDELDRFLAAITGG